MKCGVIRTWAIENEMLKQMGFRIVFFELLLLLLIFLEDKCNYVEFNMSFTLFFKIYAHRPTVHSLLAFTLNSQKCEVCLSKKKSDVGVVQKK